MEFHESGHVLGERASEHSPSCHMSYDDGSTPAGGTPREAVHRSPLMSSVNI